MINLYGVENIIYLIVSFTIIALAIAFSIVKLKDEKSKTIFIRSLAILFFIAEIVNRISIFLYYPFPDNTLLPRTFCGTVGLFFSISLLFAKKDSKLFHFFAYVCIFSGLLPTFYPNYIDDCFQYGFTSIFLFVPTISSLICHSFMFLMSILLFTTGWIKPDIKKWYFFPLGWGILTLYGKAFDVIYDAHCGFNNEEPVIASLTSPLIFCISMPVFLIFLFIYDYFKNKTNSVIYKLITKLRFRSNA